MTDHYTAAHRLPHAPGSTRAWNRSTVVRKRQIPATSLATPSSMVLLPEGAERFGGPFGSVWLTTLSASGSTR
jgi:hypothetical protein